MQEALCPYHKAHRARNQHNKPARFRFSCPLFAQKSPAVHGALSMRPCTAGLPYLPDGPLAANADFCSHLPAGFYTHAASAQRQQSRAEHDTQNQGSRAPPHACKPAQPYQM